MSFWGSIFNLKENWSPPTLCTMKHYRQQRSVIINIKIDIKGRNIKTSNVKYKNNFISFTSKFYDRIASPFLTFPHLCPFPGSLERFKIHDIGEAAASTHMAEITREFSTYSDGDLHLLNCPSLNPVSIETYVTTLLFWASLPRQITETVSKSWIVSLLIWFRLYIASNVASFTSDISARTAYTNEIQVGQFFTFAQTEKWQNRICFTISLRS